MSQYAIRKVQDEIDAREKMILIGKCSSMEQYREILRTNHDLRILIETLKADARKRENDED